MYRSTILPLSALASLATTVVHGQADLIPGAVLLTPQDLEDSLVGSSYLGTGGGGSLSEARELIQTDLDTGLSFYVLDVELLSDDGMVAVPYGLGSIAPNSSIEEELESLPEGVRVENFVEASFQVLADYLQVNFSAVVLGEIGPLSMAEGLSIAARLGIPHTDADTVGRAVPEINQHSVRVSGNPLTPASAATEFGDEMVLVSVEVPERQEEIMRGLAAISGVLGVTDAPLTGATAKEPNVLVTGSYTLCIDIGSAVREAKESGTDPIAAAVDAGDGYLLFEGVVESYEWEDTLAFLLGNVTLTGTGAFEGYTLFSDFKNEHLVAYVDGIVVATCPDLITLVDLATFEGIGNPDFTVGQSVAVIGYRSAPIWRTPEGLAVFSPEYFGYDLPYIPIEELYAEYYPLDENLPETEAPVPVDPAPSEAPGPVDPVPSESPAPTEDPSVGRRSLREDVIEVSIPYWVGIAAAMVGIFFLF